jgi:hypothetical protein
LLHFNQIPTVIDLDLKDKIAAEKDGIFLLMVQHLKPLLGRGKLPDGSAESQRLQARFAGTNDPIGSFVRLYCILDPALSVSKAALHRRFKAYVMGLGLAATVADTFLKDLYDRYADLKPIRRRITGSKNRANVIEGIKLKP